MEYMEFIKPDTKIDFVRWMKAAIIISLVIILTGIVSIIWHGGLNYGIDFAGGSLVQIKFKEEPEIDKIRDNFEGIGLENSIIQTYGTHELVVRTPEARTDLKELEAKIGTSLATAYPTGSFEIQRTEVVGPKIGKDLTKKALLAIIFSWIGILIYVGFRFEFRYAVGGVIALIHDVLVTLSIFSLMNKEFDLNIVAAMLTIIGFSINDTIVIFDRIRENYRKNIRMGQRDIINMSVNQTLSRTILTSLTVLMVLVVLFLFGGSVIHNFAFTLLVGTVAGVYSSVFIASPVVLLFERIKPSSRTRKK
ncbi:MAG: protein translocase subunit SecF [Syntrophales bacterium]|jgi:preprotein translocase subunit SecF|nr:protein translocase subunit SecF [Syntrophales bacterium]